jgi:DNA-binding Lrp family transcriptional regulator
MVSAYVLIELDTEATEETLHDIRAVPGVQHGHLVLGPTDFIGYIEAADMQALMATAMAIREVEGVVATDTRLAVM